MNTFFGAGKEPEETQKSCVSWYDYGARMYDAELGRWFVVDVMRDSAYSWNPYRYGFDSPVKFNDPTGMIEDIDIYASPTGTQPLITLKTDKIEANVYLSKDCLPGDVLRSGVTLTYDIDKLLPISIKNTDAVVISLSGVISRNGGSGGGSLDFAFFNKGKDVGKAYGYVTPSIGFGKGSGVGISVGILDFNGNSGVKFDNKILEGKSREISGGFGVVSHSKITGFMDGEIHLPFSNATKSYTIESRGFSKGSDFSFGAYFSYSIPLGKIANFKLKNQ